MAHAMPAGKSTKRVQSAPKLKVVAGSVFLNIPYDKGFENLLLAYIAAISAFGFTPRATLEIPFSERRLDRILKLILQSEYSIHDLSRVQLDRTAPRTPRFNMPFELGLVVALGKVVHPSHEWVICETVKHRVKKSLSDMDGSDAYIHGGTIKGVFREMSKAFVGSARQPTVTEMLQIYRVLRTQCDRILEDAGAQDPFGARVFKELCVLANRATNKLVI